MVHVVCSNWTKVFSSLASFSPSLVDQSFCFGHSCMTAAFRMLPVIPNYWILYLKAVITIYWCSQMCFIGCSPKHFPESYAVAITCMTQVFKRWWHLHLSCGLDMTFLLFFCFLHIFFLFTFFFVCLLFLFYFIVNFWFDLFFCLGFGFGGVFYGCLVFWVFLFVCLFWCLGFF